MHDTALTLKDQSPAPFAAREVPGIGDELEDRCLLVRFAPYS